MSENKKVDALVAFTEKEFGKGIIFRYGDSPLAMEVIPTGSFTLDKALGVGGYPQGRIIEIYGPEASGKTTLTLHAIAEAQKLGKVCAFIDVEHALDPKYAQALGVNMGDLLVSQPENAEQALDLADTLVRSDVVNLVIIDSVAALVPKAELEGDMGDSHMGLQARLMSQALRKLTAIAHEHKCTIIFINQLRMKIGVMFGNPETTTGGNALKFYASVRLDIRRIAAIKKGDENIGNKVRVKVVKNKVAPPFQEAEFDILFGQGVNKAGEVVDLAEASGILKKSGAWYSLDGTNVGQGRDNTVKTLQEDEQLFNKVVKALQTEKEN